MPPLMPLGGQGLALRPAAVSSLRCAAASAATSSARQFTTSRHRQKVLIPPESPKFINLPEPPQSKVLPRVRNKGKLPVPRQIFDLRRRAPGTPSHGRRDPRLQDGYVDTVMPRSKAELEGKDTASTPLQQWRRKLTNDRRVALEEGLKGLFKRQLKKKRAEGRERFLLRGEAIAAFDAPERRDEFLNRSTIRADTISTKVELDPLRHERAAESAKRTAAILEARAERRRDSLQGLYMAAKDFIVTEEELTKRIEVLFSEEHHAHTDPNTGSKAENIWMAMGKPFKVSERMAQFARTSNDDSRHSNEAREMQRQKNVAEELTGGRL
ncbi:hypothetical protein PpBr36_01080 [Pyricularia pennisetigena]|uniref:hypothetical protein n=1 Tax=Pyricularia pennisetigena TaxID=1578925 RepID=UPI001153A430|nr:hypothetical protein PpBr36_01080 [Pyricularia pennisetigena]TLS29195.1 hypothetical protein PpBr36_01080 [Pyricularia pennisetigena]